MRSVWLSSLFLYSSDVFVCALLVYGAAWTARRFWPPVVHVEWCTLRRFLVWQLVVILLAVVLFKAVVLDVYPHAAAEQVLSGRHGSDQVSTVAEALGGLLVAVGAVRLVVKGWSVLRAADPRRLSVEVWR